MFGFKKQKNEVDLVYIVLYNCPRRIVEPFGYTTGVSSAVKTTVIGVYKTYEGAVKRIKKYGGLEYSGNNHWASDWSKLPGTDNQEFYKRYWIETRPLGN